MIDTEKPNKRLWCYGCGRFVLDEDAFINNNLAYCPLCLEKGCGNEQEILTQALQDCITDKGMPCMWDEDNPVVFARNRIRDINKIVNIALAKIAKLV